MHSTLVRAQNVFGFFTTVVFVVSGLIAASVFFLPQHPSAEIELRNIQVVRGRPHYYSTKKEEYAHIRFDLDADFTSLFNWNTKQIFVYVLARWPSTSSSSSSSSSSTLSNITYSEAVIWDKIIASPTLQKTRLISSAPWPPPKPSTSKASSTSSSSTNKAKEKEKQKGDEKPGRIKLENVRPKYQITDISGKIAETTNVTLQVRYNIQPWVGALTWSVADPTLVTGAGIGNGKGRRKWTTGLGRWSPLKGGVTDNFIFPAIKGGKKTSSSSSSSSSS